MFHKRESLFDENEILDFLEVSGDTSILDAGCGDGFYTKMFIKRSKNVTAIDLYSDFFEELNSIGVKTYKADICTFDRGTYDLIFLANVFHDLECQGEVFERLYKICNSRVAILDFKLDTPFGPPESIRIPKEKMISIFEGNKFKLVKEKDLKYHYFLIFSNRSRF
ncbi:MAG: class I SAM-dependent methyltransferase [Thermoplasmata archaeon]